MDSCRRHRELQCRGNDGDEVSDVGSATLLAATTSVSVYTSLLPPLAEVRKATRGDAAMVNDVRLAELTAFGIVVAVGVIASSFSKSPVPTIIAVVAGVGLVLMYESVLQATPTERKVQNV